MKKIAIILAVSCLSQANANISVRPPANSSAEVQRLQAELEQLRRNQQAGGQPAAANGGAQANPEEMRHLQEEIDRLRAEVVHLKNLAGQAGGPANPGQKTQDFMHHYAQATSQARQQNFNAALEELKENVNVQGAYQLYSFLFDRYVALASKVRTPAEEAELEQIGNNLNLIQTAQGIAEASEQHAREQREIAIQQQLTEDRPSYDRVLANLDERLNNPDGHAFLLHFLKTTPRRIVTATAFAKTDWPVIGSFQKYLSVEELRALRYHLQQNDTLKSIPNTDTGRGLKELLDSISDNIRSNRAAQVPPRYMAQQFQTYMPKMQTVTR